MSSAYSPHCARSTRILFEIISRRSVLRRSRSSDAHSFLGALHRSYAGGVQVWNAEVDMRGSMEFFNNDAGEKGGEQDTVRLRLATTRVSSIGWVT